MIWYFIIDAVNTLLGAIAGFVGVVQFLPWGLDPVIGGGFGAIYDVIRLMAPLYIVIQVVMIYIGYRVAKLIFEAFLIRKALGR